VFALVSNVYYRTDDAGEHWTRFMPQDAQAACWLAVHPLRPATMFMSDLIHLWRTDDDGATWRVFPDEAGRSVLNVVFDPRDEKTYHFIHPTMVRTTEDDDATWTERPFKDHEITGRLVVSFAGNPVAVELRRNDTFIFTPGEEPHLLQIDGKTIGNVMMAFHPKDGTRMVLLRPDDLYASMDAGKTWTKAGAKNRPRDFWYWSFDPTEETVLLVFTQQGQVTAWDYATGTQTPVSASRPLETRLRCVTVAANGKTLWAGTQGDGVWRLERQK